MYYRIAAPARFFESDRMPQACLLTGRTDRLRPTEIDLSFVLSKPPSPRLGSVPVTDLIDSAEVLDAARAAGAIQRKGSRNVLLTVPVAAGELGRWRLRYQWIPLGLLALFPVLALVVPLALHVSLAPVDPLMLVSDAQVYAALGLVLGGLMVGLAANALYRKMNRVPVVFGITPQGFVTIAYDERLKAVAEQLAAAVRKFLQEEASGVRPIDGVVRPVARVMPVVAGVANVAVEVKANPGDARV